MTSTQTAKQHADARGQINRSAADYYEKYFVPALFQQWPPIMAEQLDIQANDRFLDVACGTGILARYIAKRTGLDKHVYGIDINDGMLSVAEREAPDLSWTNASAEQLHFKDNCFEKLGCQFGLMFFRNPEKAVREMYRVLKPQGMLAIAVWDSIENSPGYKAVEKLLQDLFGDHIANEIRAPFVLGKKDDFHSIIEAAGISNVEITTHHGVAQFESISEWVNTDIKGWTLAGKLDDNQFDKLHQAAKVHLKPYANKKGYISFAAPAHIALVTKQ